MNNHILNFLNIMECVIHNTETPKLPVLTEPVDWEVLGKMATAHNLFFMYHEVAQYIPEYKNSPYYEKGFLASMQGRSQQLRKTALFLHLYSEFLKEDIHPIVMKGIICRDLYGKNAELRPSGDEDILVKKEEFFKVKEIMEGCGYECGNPDVTEAQLNNLQDVPFYEKRSRFLIEVHTNLMGHGNEARDRMGACFTDVFSNVREVMIDGVPITTMGHTDHFLFLVLHAFKHFTLSGVGVRQMLDILIYQKHYEKELDWDVIRRDLKANHAEGFLGDLQAIGTRYLGFSLSEVWKANKPELLLEDMIDVGVFGRQDRADVVAMNITVSAADSKGSKLLHWIRMAFPSKKQMLDVAPYLVDRPWLLPMEWVKRWGRFIKRSKEYDGNLIADSIKKSEKRKKLLKKYGL